MEDVTELRGCPEKRRDTDRFGSRPPPTTVRRRVPTCAMTLWGHVVCVTWCVTWCVLHGVSRGVCHVVCVTWCVTWCVLHGVSRGVCHVVCHVVCVTAGYSVSPTARGIVP